MARGVGNARPWGPSAGATGAAAPRFATIAVTILRVADQAQLVVHTVFTTSSNTVGLCTIRPAPTVAHSSSGPAAAACEKGDRSAPSRRTWRTVAARSFATDAETAGPSTVIRACSRRPASILTVRGLPWRGRRGAPGDAPS